MIEDFLEEGVAMPVYMRHVHVSCVMPTSQLGVVDESDEFHQELTKYVGWAVSSGDGCDNQIHVDTEA
jgi:hypothetical protein